MKKLKISVPASSANLGPGFDTLAVAVNLENHFEFELHGSETTLEIISGIDNSLHPLCLAMIKRAAQHFFAETNAPEKHFILKVENHVPIVRGLASSATLRLAVLAGLNKALNVGVPDKEIVRIASELEACSDNAAASYFGGLVASGLIDQQLIYYRCDVPESLDFIAVWPTEAVETDKARGFPQMIPREDAVFNVNRSALLTLAFLQNDVEGMKKLFDDRLHQPFRQAKIPAVKPLYDVIQAAKDAGALGGYLSGSGSTIMALTLTNKEGIASAMQTAFAAYNMDTGMRCLKADNQGLRLQLM